MHVHIEINIEIVTEIGNQKYRFKDKIYRDKDILLFLDTNRERKQRKSRYECRQRQRQTLDRD